MSFDSALKAEFGGEGARRVTQLLNEYGLVIGTKEAWDNLVVLSGVTSKPDVTRGRRFEYIEVCELWKANQNTADGWRVAAANYVHYQSGAAGSGWHILMERPASV